MLALAVPAYIGYDCGAQGWCERMFANGVERLEQYGQFIGSRYQDFPNIIWVQGGDLTPSTSGEPSQMDLVNAVANGVAAGDGGVHYHAAHWSRGTSGADLPGLRWLDIDTTYPTFDEPVYPQVLADYERDEGVMPLFLLEASYENEHDTSMLRLALADVSASVGGRLRLRLRELSDLVVLGSRRSGLAGRGRRVPRRLGNRPRERWERVRAYRWRVLPVTAVAGAPAGPRSRIVTAGTGTYGDETYALAASTPDHATVVIYFAGPGAVTIDMGALPGPMRARFFDPALGVFTELDESPFPNSGVREIRLPESTVTAPLTGCSSSKSM